MSGQHKHLFRLAKQYLASTDELTRLDLRSQYDDAAAGGLRVYGHAMETYSTVEQAIESWRNVEDENEPQHHRVRKTETEMVTEITGYPLRACPFCGDYGVSVYERIDEGHITFQVVCNHCRARGPVGMTNRLVRDDDWGGSLTMDGRTPVMGSWDRPATAEDIVHEIKRLAQELAAIDEEGRS